jgi:hypothetical protein
MNRNLWLLAATITFQFAMCYDITNVYFTGETANFLFFFRERAQVLTKCHQFFAQMATGFGLVAYKSSHSASNSITESPSVFRTTTIDFGFANRQKPPEDN